MGIDALASLAYAPLPSVCTASIAAVEAGRMAFAAEKSSRPCTSKHFNESNEPGKSPYDKTGIGSHYRRFQGATDCWLTPPEIIRALGRLILTLAPPRPAVGDSQVPLRSAAGRPATAVVRPRVR